MGSRFPTLPPVPKKLDEEIACAKVHSCFIGKRFLGETFVPTRVCLVLDDRQSRRSCVSLPSPETPISHRRPVECIGNPTAPPLRLV
jgi:hypothetical protein